MLTTVEALQEFYVALGGNFEDVENLTTIPEMIIALSEIEISGESEKTAVVVASLKEFYVVLGGDIDDVEDVNTIAGMISAMSELGIWEEKEPLTSSEIDAIIALVE